MSVTGVFLSPFFEKCMPCWFGPTPEKTTQDQKVQADWYNVSVYKYLNSKSKSSHEYRYTVEKSSGDLYGIVDEEHPHIDSPHIIALKCAGIFLGATPYAFIIMSYRVLSFALDVINTIAESFKDLSAHLKAKNPISALGNFVIKLIAELPPILIQEISRIAKAPIFALAIMCAALFGIIAPYEGRKWVGKIEYEWHEKTPYMKDIRHRCEIYKTTPGEAFALAREGRVYFLGYCMLSRGNINDEVEGRKRFEIIERIN